MPATAGPLVASFRRSFEAEAWGAISLVKGASDVTASCAALAAFTKTVDFAALAGGSRAIWMDALVTRLSRSCEAAPAGASCCANKAGEVSASCTALAAFTTTAGFAAFTTTAGLAAFTATAGFAALACRVIKLEAIATFTTTAGFSALAGDSRAIGTAGPTSVLASRVIRLEAVGTFTTTAGFSALAGDSAIGTALSVRSRKIGSGRPTCC